MASRIASEARNYRANHLGDLAQTDNINTIKLTTIKLITIKLILGERFPAPICVQREAFLSSALPHIGPRARSTGNSSSTMPITVDQTKREP